MDQKEFEEYIALIRTDRGTEKLFPLIQYFQCCIYSDELERNAVNRMCNALAKLNAGLSVNSNKAHVMRVIEGLYWRTKK